MEDSATQEVGGGVAIAGDGSGSTVEEEKRREETPGEEAAISNDSKEKSSAHYATELVRRMKASSVLDISGSTVSDDENSHDGMTDANADKKESNCDPDEMEQKDVAGEREKRTAELVDEELANLALPMRPLAGFPDEQDRKRIVGSLAAILAASYSHDVLPPDEDDEEEEEEDDDEEEEEVLHDNQATIGEGSKNVVDDSSPPTTLLRSQSAGMEEEVENRRESKKILGGSEHGGNRSSTQLRSGKSLPVAPRSKSKLVGSEGKSTSGAGKKNAGNSDQPRIVSPAMERHRRRRYALYVDFLLSAADLLFLDRSHAKAFLPMLTRLLVPEKATKKHVFLPSIIPPRRRRQPKSDGARSVSSSRHGLADVRTSNKTPPPVNIAEPSVSLERQPSVEGGNPPEFSSEPPPSSAVIQPTAVSQESVHDDNPQDEPPVVAPGSAAVEQETTETEEDNGDPPTNDIPAEVTTDGGLDMPHDASADTEEEDDDDLDMDEEEEENGEAPLAPPARSGGEHWCEDALITPFVESLSPGAGFQCIALLMLNHLLRSNKGYDARIRHAFKKLAVVVFMHEMRNSQEEDDDELDFDENKEEPEEDEHEDHEMDSMLPPKVKQPVTNEVLAERATRKFEALEHAIAAKLIRLSMAEENQGEGGMGEDGSDEKGRRRRGITKDHVIRGLKVGGAGVVAGTLFAVTGGIAAPAIAASIAAFAGTTAATATAVVTLTSTAAVSTIFGVGGGGLAAYKMQRRTKGITEFEFQKESGRLPRAGHCMTGDPIDAELFTTVCISGWLRDTRDFQRPWGVTPTNPPIQDRKELLERFYYVYKRENIPRCARILSKWKGQERELWRLLREKYNRDPDHLFPLLEGPRIDASLTFEDNEKILKLLEEMGYVLPKVASRLETPPHEEGPYRRFMHFPKSDARAVSAAGTTASTTMASSTRSMMSSSESTRNLDDAATAVSMSTESQVSQSRPHEQQIVVARPWARAVSAPLPTSENQLVARQLTAEEKKAAEERKAALKHLETVWDYQALYGGEIYTVRWESTILMELCDSVTDLAVDLLGGATKELLKQTALATLISAVAIPYALATAANLIDGTWTLAVERADLAGIELARSLLESHAGHRPVTLVGYSMGGRTVYACLKELAKHQEIWEEQQEKRQKGSSAPRYREEDLHYPIGSSVEWGADDEEDEEDEELQKNASPRKRVWQKSIKYKREPATIVEDAIIMGLPNHRSLRSWDACRRVVAGRLVNVYSRKDMILSVMFQIKRLSGMLRPVCGTNPVAIRGVENYDVSDLISSHSDYCVMVGDILKRVRHGQPHPRAAFVG